MFGKMKHIKLGATPYEVKFLNLTSKGSCKSIFRQYKFLLYNLISYATIA
jgi:hypothetical protein